MALSVSSNVAYERQRLHGLPEPEEGILAGNEEVSADAVADREPGETGENAAPEPDIRATLLDQVMRDAREGALAGDEDAAGALRDILAPFLEAQPETMLETASLRLVDADGEGLPDLLIEVQGGAGVLLEIGAEGETKATSISAFIATDLDGAGDLDLIISTSEADEKPVRVVLKGADGLSATFHAASESEARALVSFTLKALEAMGDAPVGMNEAAWQAAGMDAAGALFQLVGADALAFSKLSHALVPQAGGGVSRALVLRFGGGALSATLSAEGFGGVTLGASQGDWDLDGAGEPETVFGGLVLRQGEAESTAMSPVALNASSALAFNENGNLISLTDAQGLVWSVEPHDAATVPSLVTVDVKGRADPLVLEGLSVQQVRLVLPVLADAAAILGVSLADGDGLNALASGLASSQSAGFALEAGVGLKVSDFFSDGAVQIFALDANGGLVASSSLTRTDGPESFSDLGSAEAGRSYMPGSSGSTNQEALGESQKAIIAGISDINNLSQTERAALLTFIAADPALCSAIGTDCTLAAWYARNYETATTSEGLDRFAFDPFEALSRMADTVADFFADMTLTLESVAAAVVEAVGGGVRQGLSALSLVVGEAAAGEADYLRPTLDGSGAPFAPVDVAGGQSAVIGPPIFGVAPAMLRAVDGTLHALMLSADERLNRKLMASIGDAAMISSVDTAYGMQRLANQAASAFGALSEDEKERLSAVHVADLMRSGNADVIFTFEGETGARIFRAGSDGTLTSYDSPVIEFSDLNGDGVDDYVIGRFAERTNETGMTVQVDLGYRRVVVRSINRATSYTVSMLGSTHAKNIVAMVSQAETVYRARYGASSAGLADLVQATANQIGSAVMLIQAYVLNQALSQSSMNGGKDNDADSLSFDLLVDDRSGFMVVARSSSGALVARLPIPAAEGADDPEGTTPLDAVPGVISIAMQAG